MTYVFVMEENSCRENISPEKVDCTALIESAGGFSVAVERCPLCSESRRPFYCSSCVNNGHFIHSNSTFPQSYLEMHRKWDLMKKETDHILQRCKTEIRPIELTDQRKTEIVILKQKIDLLKKSLAATKHLQQKDKIEADKLKHDNLIRHAKDKKHREKKRRIREYIDKVGHSISKKEERLKEKQGELLQLRQKHISDLTLYIFDISEVKQKSGSMTMGTSDEVQEALKEASQTAYIRGRWIYSSNQYRIVAPVLPCLGDYSQYNICVAKMREDNVSVSAGPQGHPKDTISAGLCYTSQLVAVLAHILSISLPKRQCYSEFCGNELSEKQFNKVVSRLNQNVLYLCFSQGVEPDNMEPKHTLHNIVALLNSSQLGRIGSFDIVQDMMDSVEDSNGNSEESDEECVHGYDEPDIAAEWEDVPQDLPDAAVDTASLQTGYMSQNLSESSLLSSAVSSVTSFFRR